MDSPSSREIRPERPQESCHQSHFPSCFQRHSLGLRGRNNKGELFCIFCGLSSLSWCDQIMVYNVKMAIKFRLTWHIYSVLPWMSCKFDCRQPLSSRFAVLVVHGFLRHKKKYTSLHEQCDIPMVISPVSACLIFKTVHSDCTHNLCDASKTTGTNWVYL